MRPCSSIVFVIGIIVWSSSVFPQSTAPPSASPVATACSAPIGTQEQLDEWLSKCAVSFVVTSKTTPRKSVGEFRHNRGIDPRTGEKLFHQGVDVMLASQGYSCLASTELDLKANNLAIYVIADGKVAYARMNSPGLCPRGVKVCGPEYWRSGLGLTIIVDHGNGVYSLYAHLAQDAGRSCSIYEVDDDLYKMAVQRGDPVKKGQLIGYMGQVDYRYGIAKPEPADGVTGNAANELSEAVQVHFELFLAKPGRGSDFLVSEIVPKEDRGIIDPTKFISGLWQASSPRITPHPPTNAE